MSKKHLYEDAVDALLPVAPPNVDLLELFPWVEFEIWDAISAPIFLHSLHSYPLGLEDLEMRKMSHRDEIQIDISYIRLATPI